MSSLAAPQFGDIVRLNPQVSLVDFANLWFYYDEHFPSFSGKNFRIYGVIPDAPRCAVFDLTIDDNGVISSPAQNDEHYVVKDLAVSLAKSGVTDVRAYHIVDIDQELGKSMLIHPANNKIKMKSRLSQDTPHKATQRLFEDGSPRPKNETTDDAKTPKVNAKIRTRSQQAREAQETKAEQAKLASAATAAAASKNNQTSAKAPTKKQLRAELERRQQAAILQQQAEEARKKKQQEEQDTLIAAQARAAKKKKKQRIEVTDDDDDDDDQMLGHLEDDDGDDFDDEEYEEDEEDEEDEDDENDDDDDVPPSTQRPRFLKDRRKAKFDEGTDNVSELPTGEMLVKMFLPNFLRSKFFARMSTTSVQALVNKTVKHLEYLLNTARSKNLDCHKWLEPQFNLLSIALRACLISAKLSAHVANEVHSEPTFLDMALRQHQHILTSTAINVYIIHEHATAAVNFKGGLVADDFTKIPVGDKVRILSKVLEDVFISSSDKIDLRHKFVVGSRRKTFDYAEDLYRTRCSRWQKEHEVKQATPKDDEVEVNNDQAVVQARLRNASGGGRGGSNRRGGGGGKKAWQGNKLSAAQRRSRARHNAAHRNNNNTHQGGDQQQGNAAAQKATKKKK